jgi:hypothetical protein
MISANFGSITATLLTAGNAKLGRVESGKAAISTAATVEQTFSFHRSLGAE